MCMRKRVILLFACWCFCAVARLSAADILVEAESFAEKGGWKVDQQFMDVMGSPYLLAHGMGRPVKDARTTFQVDDEGWYRVYVRTYNWTSPWHKGRGPGAFGLQVDGKKLKTELGTEGTCWQWQKAGDLKLRAGSHTLALHDLTGFDGRCDAILLIREAREESQAALDELRAQLLFRPMREAATYDLVVVGGGVAGMCAAISAARLGCKVALVHDRPVLGGNNSSEVRVHLGGRIEVGPYPALGGLLKEWGPSKEGNAQPAAHYEDEKKLEAIRREPNIDLFLNQHVNQVEMEGMRIRAVVAQDVESGKLTRFAAPTFCDCTGDGTVGYLAGADYRMGREGRAEFGESIAPEQPDTMVLGASVQWYSAEEKQKSTFPEFSYGVAFNDSNAQRVYMGEWTWETGMDRNQITEFERIRDYGLLVVYSNWSWMKNHSEDRGRYAQRRLDWVAYVAGKRESRRLMGDYVLKEDDLKKHVFHEDASFTASWSIDLHRMDPENLSHFPNGAFKAVTTHHLIYPYGVPYRCLYSRNVENLLMAGRHISVTHVALGTVRVMRTTAQMGEVVGMAASLCRRYRISPRGVYQSHLEELKQLMRQGVARDGIPNNQRYNEGGTLTECPVVK